MSIRIGIGIRPSTLGLYASESTSLFTRMDLLGETPDKTRKSIINTNIERDKSAIGFTSKYDAFWLLASHAKGSAKLNIIKNAHNITEVDTPTFTIDRGFTGNGASDALETNYTPATEALKLTQNLASFGFYSRKNIDELTHEMSAESVANDGIMTAVRFGNTNYFSVNGAYGSYIGCTDSSGMWIFTRYSSTAYRVYRNGIQVYDGGGAASSALVNVMVNLLRRNIAGVNSRYSNQELALCFIGGLMTQTDATNFQTIWVDGYLTSVGAKI